MPCGPEFFWSASGVKRTSPYGIGTPSSFTEPDTRYDFGPESPQPSAATTATRAAAPDHRPIILIIRCLAGQKFGRTSPPLRLAIGFRTLFKSTVALRNRTLPSASVTLQPPAWLLPMLVLLYVPALV